MGTGLIQWQHFKYTVVMEYFTCDSAAFLCTSLLKGDTTTSPALQDM